VSVAVCNLLSAETFAATFARTMGIGLWPMGIELSYDPQVPSNIDWDSEYKTVTKPPRQTLLYVPSLQMDNISHFGRIHQLRSDLDKAGKKQPVKGQDRQQDPFASRYAGLQGVIDAANDKWQQMESPAPVVLEFASQVFTNCNMVQQMGSAAPKDFVGRVAKNAVSAAIMSLGIGTERKSTKHVTEDAAFFLVHAAKMFAQVWGHDAHALLRELAYAAYAMFFLRLNDYDDLDGVYRSNLEDHAKASIAAWREALPSTLDPVYDAVRIFGGIRACITCGRYADMIPFLDRHSMLHPGTASEDDLRTAWAYLASPQASHANWLSAVTLMEKVISAWVQNSSRAAQVETLAGLKKNAEKIIRSNQVVAQKVGT
jgi:hypothetical protein